MLSQRSQTQHFESRLAVQLWARHFGITPHLLPSMAVNFTE